MTAQSLINKGLANAHTQNYHGNITEIFRLFLYVSDKNVTKECASMTAQSLINKGLGNAHTDK